MYTRNFFPEQSTDINIPENYDGVALREAPEDDFSEEEIHNAPESVSASSRVKIQNETEESGIAGWLKKLPFKIPFLDTKGLSSGIFSSFGTEELLIIGIALFLIFSGTHDVECAIMILLLLFVK